MSAAELREAAALMRSRAEAANEGPWVTGEHWTKMHQVRQPFDGGSFEVAGSMVKADAAHIASWHPAVALAVADWLDLVAAKWAPGDIPWPIDVAALNVARQYLGTAS